MSEGVVTARKTPWAWTIGTFFGVGLPNHGRGMGTVASAVTLGLWLLALHATHVDASSRAGVMGTLAAAAIAIAIGIAAGGICARESGVEDPSQVVVDEVAGQLIALTGAVLDWKYLLAAFILFRGFDALKPPLVSHAERAPGGLGIMLDDVVAGVFALIILRLVHHFGVI